MRLKGLITVTIALFTSAFCMSAVAQDGSGSKLESYTPPPLFGAPRFPDKQDPKVAPSKNPAYKKTAPLPLRRPNRTVSKPIVTDKAKDFRPQGTPPNTAVKQQEPSHGVVKGPKTMPAVKADGVEAEAIQGDVNDAPTDMLVRVQKQNSAPSDLVQESIPARKYPALDTSKAHIILFEPQASELNAEQIDVLNNAVLPALNDNNMALNIISYASPAGDGFSSDRRLSLSRALAVRAALMDKGYDPSKINVRALGADTNKQPFDRIELEFLAK